MILIVDKLCPSSTVEKGFKAPMAIFCACTQSFIVIGHTSLNKQTFINEFTSLLNASVILPGAAPYQWFVRSKSTLTPTTSDSSSWQFYLEGDPNSSHFPFPANLLVPQDKTTIVLNNNSFNLEWQGNDLDDDIIFYDLYLGNDPTQLILKKAKNLEHFQYHHLETT